MSFLDPTFPLTLEQPDVSHVFSFESDKASDTRAAGRFS